MTAIGQYIVTLRKTFAGPDKSIKKCGCGYVASTREIRQHTCDQKPPRGKEALAGAKDSRWYEEFGPGFPGA